MYFKMERMAESSQHFSLNRDWIWGLLLFSATFLAYRPAWNGKPVWDDDMHMTRPELRPAAGLVRIWTQPGAVPQYYPLVHSVFWVERRLFGDSTTGCHLLNILLHVFSALLLVMILRKLGISGKAAWLAAGIFALHPVMVESVAWITELKNTLSGVFFLSAALAYLTFDHKREKKHYAMALILFLLGLLSKSVIVTLPAVLLVVFWWKRGSIGWKRDVAPLVPFFVIGIFSGLFTAWVERRYIGAAGSEFNLAFMDRCLIAGRAFWFYLYKLLWPADLIFIYPRWHIDAAAVWQYLFPTAFLLLAVVFWQLRGRTRAPLAVFLYFGAALFPALGFFNVYPFRYSFVADHFQYLAALGPITAAAACIAQGTGLLQEKIRRLLQPLLSGVLLSILFLLTWNQSRMYSDAETLYRTTITKNDDCWLAHNNLGLLLAAKGRTDEAIAQYRMAIASNFNVADIHNNLGLLLVQNGRTDEAIEHYRKALEINPTYDDAYYNLGVLLAKTGRTVEAIAHYQKVLELNPFCGDAHYNLGVLLAKVGRTNDAMVHFLKALEFYPDNAEAHNNLGILLAQTGRTKEAIAYYQKALELNPDYGDAHYNLGVLLAKMGRTDEAIAHYQKALEINPNHAESHNNLGALLAQSGRTDEAIAHYRKALAINPEAIDPLQNIAFAFVQKGLLTNAASVLQKALASAKSEGDELRAKTIAQIIARLHLVLNSSQAALKKHAQ
jgi:protein O-mannosyl-transferase